MSGLYTWKATPPQSELWRTMFHDPHSWALAFVAGFGSGKSEVLHMLAITTISLFPWANVAIYSPTYDLIKLNNLPRVQEELTKAGIKHKLNKQDFIITTEFGNNIIFRSMDNPSRIIAYEVFYSFIDELDTMPAARAEEAWNKIISRNRQQPPHGASIPKGTIVELTETAQTSKSGKHHALQEDTFFDPCTFSLINKVGVFTTPEGYKFTYRKWKKEDNAGYRLIRASTYSNPHLPASYIENLKASYPPQLIEAYLEGEFVNLTGGRVYHAFSRDDNHFNAEDLIDERVELVAI